MFVINRKQGQQIKIGDAIIQILSKGRVKLGVLNGAKVEFIKDEGHNQSSRSDSEDTSEGVGIVSPIEGDPTPSSLLSP